MANVTAAALFSNTRYATMKYVMGEETRFDHTVVFNVVGSGISRAYSESKTATRTFEIGGENKRVVYRPHYVNTLMDELFGIQTGITDPVPEWGWGLNPTQEYIDPNDLTEGYEDFTVTPGDAVDDDYTETSSLTWQGSLGIDFAIKYKAFGLPVELSLTVSTTSGKTNKVYYKIDRSGDQNPNNLVFRVYTQGAFYNEATGTGGMELHIWDMSGAG